MKPRKKAKYERYPFENSPWAQNLTQRDLAELLGWKKQRLEALVRDKDSHIKRGPKLIGTKMRELAVPTGELRTIHERIKIHLNKIKQPEYLFSPRKGRAQRDNAEHHVGQNQILSLDIKQFYPSTTDEHIFRWAHHTAGLKSDVAGLFTKLVAIDGKMPFGSPVSPVLTTLVHRKMFDDIFDICRDHDLRMSLWVDDLVISGAFVRGEIVEKIRAIIRRFGFQTHKIKFKSTARPVIITGVPLVRTGVGAPISLHRRIQSGYAELRQVSSDAEESQAIDRLLAALGTFRYHIGASSAQGRLASNRMNALRTRRARLKPVYVTRSMGPFLQEHLPAYIDDDTPPWE